MAFCGQRTIKDLEERRLFLQKKAVAVTELFLCADTALTSLYSLSHWISCDELLGPGACAWPAFIVEGFCDAQYLPRGDQLCFRPTALWMVFSSIFLSKLSCLYSYRKQGPWGARVLASLTEYWVIAWGLFLSR